MQNAQKNNSNNMMNIPLITADSRLITQENQAGPPPPISDKGHAAGNQGQKPAEKKVQLPLVEEVCHQQIQIEEEDKFEFGHELDLVQNNRKLHIEVVEKMEEEKYPLRNKVNKQHQSTKVLMI